MNIRNNRGWTAFLWACVAVTICFVLYYDSAWAENATTVPTTQPSDSALVLKMYCVIDGPTPSIMCEATNISEKAITISEFRSEGNMLLIKGPDGRERQDFITGPPETKGLAPKHSVCWKFKLGDDIRFARSGKYEVTWLVADTKSHPICLWREKEPQKKKPIVGPPLSAEDEAKLIEKFKTPRFPTSVPSVDRKKDVPSRPS